MRITASKAETKASPRADANWFHALRAALLLMLLCGGVYPLLTVSLGTLMFPHQATGSLIERDGKLIGSALVGQPFAAPGYFHSRPSAAGYDPFAVAGSNQAPSHPDLRQRAQGTSADLAAKHGVAPASLPVDLIAASGSGIDPHISPPAASLQIDRIAEHRGMARDAIAELVADHVEPSVLGILGQPRINVLQLNLALDAMTKTQ